MEKISVIIPAFNEAAAIGPVIHAIKALNLQAEVVVVDDGSTDETAHVARESGAVVIQHPANRGYGRSLKDGIAHASSDIIVITDADGTYPINRIPDLLKEFERGFDMVVGSREGKVYRGSILKGLLRRILKLIVEYATGRTVPDVNSGLRIFRASAAKPYFPDICDGFSFTTTITLVYMLTHKSVSYLPIAYEKRVGRSKVKMIHDTLRTLQYITECIVRYNPLKIFIVLAGAQLIAGAIGWALMNVSAFFVAFLFACLTMAIGMIAESMRRPRA